MPACQQVPLQPALNRMFREDFHHPTIRSEMIVIVVDLGLPGTIGGFQNVLPSIRVVLIW